MIGVRGGDRNPHLLSPIILVGLLGHAEESFAKTIVPHDGRQFDTEFEPAQKEYNDKILIRKGTMAGLLVTASTTYRDAPVVTIELRFLLDDDYVSEAFLAGRPRHGWIEVDVRGTPGSRITHELYMEETVIGTWSTGTRAVYAIPAVCAAASGLLSPLDLPLAHRPPAVAPR